MDTFLGLLAIAGVFYLISSAKKNKALENQGYWTEIPSTTPITTDNAQVSPTPETVNTTQPISPPSSKMMTIPSEADQLARYQAAQAAQTQPEISPVVLPLPTVSVPQVSTPVPTTVIVDGSDLLNQLNEALNHYNAAVSAHYQKLGYPVSKYALQQLAASIDFKQPQNANRAKGGWGDWIITWADGTTSARNDMPNYIDEWRTNANYQQANI